MSWKGREKSWSNMRYYVDILLNKITENLAQDSNLALLSASQNHCHLREIIRSKFFVLQQQT